MNRAQGILSNSEKDDIREWLKAFLLDRKIRHVSSGSIRFYHQKLEPFVDWCDQERLTGILQIGPHQLRLFFYSLEETGHNPGGCHAFYRAVRAFLNFFEDEVEPESWRNPIRKVAAPRVPDRPIDPIPIEEVSRLLETCDPKSFYGNRDKAILLVLLDTGVRANELLDINLEDVNLIDGSIQIRNGKGGKVRVVFIGKKAKKAVRFWLRKRPQNSTSLFTTKKGDRLNYSGLRAILKRRSKRAGISGASLHDFRRAFCLAQLQAGTPETTIARYMGHSNTQLIAVYARQTTRDLHEIYHSVGDAEL